MSSRNGTETIRWWTSPACLRMLGHLECRGPSTYVDMARVLYIQPGYAHALCKRVLLPAGVVHIPAWRINARGPASPIFAIGPGKNKRRPKPETPKQRADRRRKSLIDLFGNHIASAVLNRGRTTVIMYEGRRVRTGSHQSHIAGKIVGDLDAVRA